MIHVIRQPRLPPPSPYSPSKQPWKRLPHWATRRAPWCRAAAGRIWLGTFRFTGGSAGTTTLSVTDWDTDPGAVDFQYYDADNSVYVSLDDEIVPGTAQLTAAVPEPGSLGLVLAMSGAGAVVAVYRRRRERTQQVSDIAAC